jgi:hypothetical protein
MLHILSDTSFFRFALADIIIDRRRLRQSTLSNDGVKKQLVYIATYDESTQQLGTKSDGLECCRGIAIEKGSSCASGLAITPEQVWFQKRGTDA